MNATFSRPEREVTVKRAAKTERKRHPGLAADSTAVGHLRARKQSDQRRFAGTIGTQDPEIVTRRELYRCILEHDSAAAGGWISLGDPVEGDHSGTLSLRRSARSSENP